MSRQADGWLRRVHHDLVKRMLWPARDRRDLGGSVTTGELVVALIDDEGRALAAPALWRTLRDEAPSMIDPRALDAFGSAVLAAGEAAARDDAEGVLALETAYAELARNVKEGTRGS